MTYKVVWKEEAIEDLTKIDRTMAQKIFDKVENYLTKNPTEYGKPLVGNLKGLWRYRFSDYRVIYQVQQSELLILVVEVGHRKEIY